MKFDSNRTWGDAISAVRANREVLLALGGVFFLLPALLSSVFLTDLQTQMMKAMGKPEIMARLMEDNTGSLLGFGLGGMLVQMIGYLSVTALISNYSRPTVGDSIRRGLGSLLTLFGISALCFIVLTLGLTVVSMVLVGLFSVLGLQGLGAAVTVSALVAGCIYGAVKLSLVVPVIVNEGVRSPIVAMVRSWRLTQGNALRLFSFYVLLTMGYFVIAMVSTLILITPIMLILGESKFAVLGTGLVSGGVGAVASIVIAAVLSQTHRQLAGPSAETVATTFE